MVEKDPPFPIWILVPALFYDQGEQEGWSTVLTSPLTRFCVESNKIAGGMGIPTPIKPRCPPGFKPNRVGTIGPVYHIVIAGIGGDDAKLIVVGTGQVDDKHGFSPFKSHPEAKRGRIEHIPPQDLVLFRDEKGSQYHHGTVPPSYSELS